MPRTRDHEGSEKAKIEPSKTVGASIFAELKRLSAIKVEAVGKTCWEPATTRKQPNILQLSYKGYFLDAYNSTTHEEPLRVSQSIMVLDPAT